MNPIGYPNTINNSIFGLVVSKSERVGSSNKKKSQFLLGITQSTLYHFPKPSYEWHRRLALNHVRSRKASGFTVGVDLIPFSRKTESYSAIWR